MPPTHTHSRCFYFSKFSNLHRIYYFSFLLLHSTSLKYFTYLSHQGHLLQGAPALVPAMGGKIPWLNPSPLLFSGTHRAKRRTMRCNYFNWLWLIHLHDKCVHILGNSGLLLQRRRPLGQRGTLGLGGLEVPRGGYIAAACTKSHGTMLSVIRSGPFLFKLEPS